MGSMAPKFSTSSGSSAENKRVKGSHRLPDPSGRIRIIPRKPSAGRTSSDHFLPRSYVARPGLIHEPAIAMGPRRQAGTESVGPGSSVLARFSFCSDSLRFEVGAGYWPVRAMIAAPIRSLARLRRMNDGCHPHTLPASSRSTTDSGSERWLVD